MQKLTRRQFLELRRHMHEDYLHHTYPFPRFEIRIEGDEAVVSGYEGGLEVRFPAKVLVYYDALRRRGF